MSGAAWGWRSCTTFARWDSVKSFLSGPIVILLVLNPVFCALVARIFISITLVIFLEAMQFVVQKHQGNSWFLKILQITTSKTTLLLWIVIIISFVQFDRKKVVYLFYFILLIEIVHCFYFHLLTKMLIKWYVCIDFER